MTNKELADLIFPNAKSAEYYEALYPERDLPEGAVVTRFAPSPTGFVHIGGLLQCIVEKSLVTRHGGVLMLRIEDTDQKRKVENGVEQIVSALKDFDIEFDEGMLNETDSVGDYGPYIQSARKDIYDAYVKHLMEIGRAYPCFATEEELEAIREKQREEKATPGYYGKWALYRDLSADEAAERIKRGDAYVIRFRSEGDGEKEAVLHDLIRGDITFKQNEMDIVILKNDGLPTYHFAHAVDDHLMHTTHVIRSDEWVSSAPIHLELFEALGFKLPNYCHYSPMLKEEDGKKRKISKRKDPEAAVTYYRTVGIPNEAVKEYLMGVANSGFEEWRAANPDKDLYDFDFRLDKMSISGALFDMDKLKDISKQVISTYSPERLYEQFAAWCGKYSPELKKLADDKDYCLKVFSIERDENGTKRKDLYCMEEISTYFNYMFDELFDTSAREEFKTLSDPAQIKAAFEGFLSTYDEADDNPTWFEKTKDVAESLGYARDFKTWKKNKESYPGHVGDICTALRIALTGRSNTPDLYSILHVLGKDRIETRLKAVIASL